jgi:hypothetical protein
MSTFNSTNSRLRELNRFPLNAGPLYNTDVILMFKPCRIPVFYFNMISALQTVCWKGGVHFAI